MRYSRPELLVVGTARELTAACAGKDPGPMCDVVQGDGWIPESSTASGYDPEDNEA